MKQVSKAITMLAKSLIKNIITGSVENQEEHNYVYVSLECINYDIAFTSHIVINHRVHGAGKMLMQTADVFFKYSTRR